jgi:hypothetical protein
MIKGTVCNSIPACDVIQYGSVTDNEWHYVACMSIYKRQEEKKRERERCPFLGCHPVWSAIYNYVAWISIYALPQTKTKTKNSVDSLQFVVHL